MAKRRIAVYDADRIYRERFAGYLMKEKAGEMELAVFSQADYLLKAVREEDYHLIVLGKGYEKVCGELSEGGLHALVLTEEAEEVVSQTEELYYTPKYQSMDKIIRQICLLADKRQKEGQVRSAPGIEVIGVYSPVKHEMQMMFSLLCAKIRAEESRTLYLNFMEYSGFYGMLETETDYDMGDIVLRLREQRLCAEEFYRGICETEHISCLCPFKNPENLLEFCTEDCRRLLNFIAEHTDYKTVVIDFGSQTEDFPGMLHACTIVYCIGKNGYYFQCRMEEFLDYLNKTMEESFFERFQVLELPFQAKWIRGGKNLLEQLGWSEFGDFVRRFLEGGGYEDSK